jgi:hypothetical protein
MTDEKPAILGQYARKAMDEVAAIVIAVAAVTRRMPSELRARFRTAVEERRLLRARFRAEAEERMLDELL